MNRPTAVSNASTNTLQLDEESIRLRRHVLRALAAADKGHIGSALSMIEILRVLYRHVARHDPGRPTWIGRDRVILSKGHGCLALYAVLADVGYFPVEALDTFCASESPFGGHPERKLELGIEASTGSLGHGLPFAVGIAIAHKKLGDDVRIFAVVGDGELNEGSNWEALLIASKHKLGNLCVVVDNNNQQINGPLDAVLPMEPLRLKFQAFGADVREVDGHDVAALISSLSLDGVGSERRPTVVICKTIKGKGLPVAERNPSWHYRRSFGKETLDEISRQWSIEPSVS